LWQPARSFDKHQFAYAKDPWNIQAALIRRAEKYLATKVGEKYKEIVLRCLKGDFSAMQLNNQTFSTLQDFRREVVDVLKQAADSL
jgi:hypothetical protein